MSYDWTIEAQAKDITCPHCGGVTGRDNGGTIEHWDPTYNLGAMFSAATGTPGGIHDFDGKTVAEVTPLVEAMFARMVASPTTFRAHDSPNGRGTYDEWLPFFGSVVLPAFHAAPPDAIVRVR